MRIQHVFWIMFVSLLPWSCTPSDPDLVFAFEKDSFSCSTATEISFPTEYKVEFVFPSSGGTAQVAIKASDEWKASFLGSSRVDWCSFSPASGSSTDSRLVLTVTGNDDYADRNCTIVMDCGVERRTIVVKQRQKDAFSLTPLKVEIPSVGGNFEVEVSRNIGFTFTVEESAMEWIIPARTRGMATETVQFTVLENPDSEPRKGTVHFKGETVGDETVTVYQEGREPCIVPTERIVSVEADGGTIQVEVRSNVDYDCEIVEGASWLTETSTRSTVSALTRQFVVSPNLEEVSRTGKIVFSNQEYHLSETVTVSQKGAVYFSITPDQVEIEPEGGIFDVEVTSTLGYGISSMPDWIHEVEASTRASGRSSFMVDKNLIDEERSGTIVFFNENGTSIPVAVRQKPRVINVDWNGKFYHRSLFMRITATWCTWCPRMYRSVVLAQEAYPDKIIHVALHGSDSDLAFSQTRYIENQFHTYYYPAGIVDGRTEIHNEVEEEAVPKIVAAAKETESLYQTKTGIEISSLLSGRTLSISTTVYAKVSGQYKLTLLLLEDGIVHSQSGVQGLFFHNDVARIAVNDIRGEEFTIAKDKGFKDFSYSVTIPGQFDLQNMKILAYVQTSFGSSPKVQTQDYGDFYVDNSVVVPMGISFGPQIIGSVTGGGNEGFKPGNDIEM